MLAIRHRAAVKGRAETNRKRAAKPGTYRYFVRGHDHKATAVDHEVEVKKRKRLLQYDKLLKKFRYAEALDSVLKSADRPVVVASFLQELIYRSALKRALAGRDETTLKPMLTFLSRNITNPRFASVLIDTGVVILELYGPVMGQSPAIDECFVKLQTKLQVELKFQQHLFELLGQMDLLLASQESGETPT
jgi:U3 small nucleolar RNA-associated protein 15